MRGLQIALATASGGGSGGSRMLLLTTAIGLGVTAGILLLSYRFGWHDQPDTSFESHGDERTDTQRAAGVMYESSVAESETESVDHDAFDPVGTATLLALYFAVVSLTWLFMYFVEFLDNGPTVIG